MKKVLLALAIVFVLAAVALTAVFVTVGGTKKGKRIYADEVVRRDIVELVKASGEVNARVKVNISSPLIAKIEKLYVEEGDEIAAGKPFLELEKQAFVAARDDWASRLEMARNEVEQAKINLADSELKAERARRLATDGILTKEQLEAAELGLASARLRLTASQEQVVQARANLAKAQDDLSKTTIFAPLTGRVVNLQAEEGEVVISGTINNAASVIGIIADLSEILAEVDVDETEIVRVRVGQQAELSVDALPERTFKGRVMEIGSSGFNRPQQPDVTFFRVKLLFESPDAALLPGMSVRADIQTAERKDVPVAPIQAVVRRPPPGAEVEKKEGAVVASASKKEAEEIEVVFVIADGKAVQTPVETGLADETAVEIASGLAGGEKVVSGPYRVLKDLKNGEAVTIDDRKDEDKKPGKDDKDEDG